MNPRPPRSSLLTEIWTTLATTSGVGYLATAYAVSRWLTRPSPAIPRLPAIASHVVCEDLECRTKDGVRLAGWVIAPPKPRGTLALFHGLRHNRGQLVERILFLAEAGYRCVAVDHRAHGQSAGRCTSFGFHESRDVLAVLEIIQQRWPDQPRAALGISMGAAALCFAAPRAGVWNALVLESVYHDLAAAFSTRVGSDYPAWFHRFSRGVIWLTERRLRLRLPELAPVRYIGALAPSPILLLTGTEDVHAAPADVQKLFEQCRGPREFCVIPGADHLSVWQHGGKFYRDLVLNFLNRHLPPAA